MQLDKATNRLATPTCPDDTRQLLWPERSRADRDQQNGVTGFFSRFFGGGEKPLPPPTQASPAQTANGQEVQDPNNPDGKKKKGFFGKLEGIFKDDKSSAPPPKPAENGQTPPQ